MNAYILLALSEEMKMQFREYCQSHDITMSQKLRHMITELLKTE